MVIEQAFKEMPTGVISTHYLTTCTKQWQYIPCKSLSHNLEEQNERVNTSKTRTTIPKSLMQIFTYASHGSTHLNNNAAQDVNRMQAA